MTVLEVVMANCTARRAGVPVHSATVRSGLSDPRGVRFYALLTGSFLTLLLSVSLLGQTSQGQQNSSSSDPDAKICNDPKSDEGSDKLALRLRRSSSSELISDDNSSEQQAGSQLESNRMTPTVRRSEAAPAEPVCSKTESGNEAEPAPNPVQVQQPSAKPAAPQNTIVSDSNGNWTIYPRDASLRQVMQSIRASTGIPMELPAEGLEERVFGNIGPKPPREALSQLLEGAEVNYVLQTSPQNPQAVTRVFVTSRTQTAGGRQVQPAIATMDQRQGELPFAGSAPEETEAEVAQPAPAPPQAHPASVPGIPAGFNLQEAAAAAHKTPAQLLGEMQRQQIEILDAQSPPPAQ